MVKIALVSTSAPLLKDEETGVWLEEIAVPYYKLNQAGFEVVVASPAGGPIPLDAGSLTPAFLTEAGKQFLMDPAAMGALSHSKTLADLKADDFDAVYLPGGHGCCVDFVNNPTLKSFLETLYHKGKLVATVCHGPICLAECTQADGKTPLVQGKTVTGFADSEEEAVQKVHLVPYLIESRFKEQGAKYEKADADWTSKICIDGNLITGQNPQSSEAAAEAVIAYLKK